MREAQLPSEMSWTFIGSERRSKSRPSARILRGAKSDPTPEWAVWPRRRP